MWNKILIFRSRTNVSHIHPFIMSIEMATANSVSSVSEINITFLMLIQWSCQNFSYKTPQLQLVHPVPTLYTCFGLYFVGVIMKTKTMTTTYINKLQSECLHCYLMVVATTSVVVAYTGQRQQWCQNTMDWNTLGSDKH